MMSIPPDVARRIRVVLLDADGVLTDGGIYVAERPDGSVFDMRRFHIRDGLGIKMLQRGGISVAIVSAKNSAAVRRRAADVGIEEVLQVPSDGKVEAVEGLLARWGIDWPETALLADDLADVALLRFVGLPAAVADAVPEVRRVAAWQGELAGGRGAVREFAEALLGARGEWDALVEQYVNAGTPRRHAGAD